MSTDQGKRANPFLGGTIGKSDTRSRAKAEVASNASNLEVKQVESQQQAWPLGRSGNPMVKAEISLSELVPTGQYANVAIGPCRIHFLIDPDAPSEAGVFSSDQRENIAKALNQAMEIIGGDVVAVQRNLVMENIQSMNEG